MGSELNKIFEEIYYINLKSRPDKLKFIEDQLNKNNVIATRFEAVNTTDVKKFHKHKYELNESNYGKIACMESHRKIWGDCLKRDVSSVLILEDDVQFVDNFNHIFKEKLKTLPRNWNFLALGYNRNKSFLYKKNLVKFKMINNDWETFDGISGSGAWGLKNTMMSKLLSATDDNIKGENFDLFLTQSKFFEEIDLRLYSTIDQVIIQNTIGASDINEANVKSVGNMLLKDFQTE
jgi:GR25 family glycosyltransferase involved in LPS biosynthesis